MVEFEKVPGTENPADLFTKIQGLGVFQQMESQLMKKL